MFIYRDAEHMIAELRQEIERNIKRQDDIIKAAKGARSQAALLAQGSRAAYYGMLSMMQEGSYQFREQPQPLKMEDPLSQDCPTCGALAGKPCRNSSLREQRAVHARRIKTYYEQPQEQPLSPEEIYEQERQKALAVACPSCSALPGHRCRNSSLGEMEHLHPRRHAAGRKAAQAAEAQADCYACGGDGWVDSINPITGTTECPYCKGTGKGNGAPLPRKAAQADKKIDQAERALLAGCPTCLAEPGSLCTNADQTVQFPAHLSRIEASLL